MTYVDPAVRSIDQAMLELVDSDAFAPRDPEAAPLWLEIVCGLLMVVIWGATFYAIGGM